MAAGSADHIEIRALTLGDEGTLEAFFHERRDSSMFLRSSVRRGGLGRTTYAGAFRDARLVGVVAHGSNGTLLLQAPASLPGLVQACVSWSQRRISGLSGPLDQVHRARTVLGLDAADVSLQGDEGLYALDLTDLVVPEALATGAVACRPPVSSERNALCDWRLAYDVEAIGALDTPEQRARASAYLDAQIAEQRVWVAVKNEVPVSIAGFNAELPDMVQLGGIYTPPEHRGRGFAKVAVAGSLLMARERGVSRAVLFTSNSSAVRTYAALGFVRVGEYSVVLFK
jgi:uncharacterized protein